MLSITDNNSDNGSCGYTYTLTAAPKLGQLMLNGTVLQLGSANCSFTSADVAAGHVQYQRTGSDYGNDAVQQDSVQLKVSENITSREANRLAPTNIPIYFASINMPPELVGGQPTGTIPVVQGATTSLNLGGLQFTPGHGPLAESGQTISYSFTVLPSDGNLRLADGTTNVVQGNSYTLAQVQGLKYLRRAILPPRRELSRFALRTTAPAQPIAISSSPWKSGARRPCRWSAM